MLTPSEQGRRTVAAATHVAALLLSLALVAYITVDTLAGVDFLANAAYMRFQLWVCLVFTADFFAGLWLASDRPRYLCRRWPVLLLSLPYLNILSQFGGLTAADLTLLRYVPLARGSLALAMLIGYVTSNPLASLFRSYVAIVVMVIYFASLIFFDCERGVNPLVPDYGAALWWAWMDATTIGSDIYPTTAVGKLLGVVLAALGMLMFPLFTVYITDWVRRHAPAR